MVVAVIIPIDSGGGDIAYVESESQDPSIGQSLAMLRFFSEYRQGLNFGLWLGVLLAKAPADGGEAATEENPAAAAVVAVLGVDPAAAATVWMVPEEDLGMITWAGLRAVKSFWGTWTDGTHIPFRARGCALSLMTTTTLLSSRSFAEVDRGRRFE